MGILAQDTRGQAAPPSVSPFLDREGARARVAVHVATKRPIEELSIERNKPADSKDFAFVGMAPKRSAQSNWYRCSFCQTDRKFSAGRVVLSSDGLLRLIGDECWNLHLDKDRYGCEVQDWRDYERKERFARIRQKVCPAITTVADKVLDALKGSADALRFAAELPRTLRDGAPLLANRLEQARRNGGRLQVDRVVRDYAAMERGGSERFIPQAETLHIVRGLDAAVGSVRPIDTELRQVLPRLHSVKRAIYETQWDSISNQRAAKTISAIEKDIQVAILQIGASSLTINNACDFLSFENIGGIVRWGSDPDCDFVLEGVALKRLPDGFQFHSPEGIFELRRPSNLVRGLLPDTDELKRAVDFS